MSLESLLAPAKWMDKEVQKQFTRIGKHIPEKNLYKIALGADLIAFAGIGVMVYNSGQGISSIITSCILGTTIGLDVSYDIDGLWGKIIKEWDADSVAIDRIQHFVSRYIKVIRLPVFLTGVGFLGKAVYDVAAYFLNGAPLTLDTAIHAAAGFGFLSLASSMYLKDQDPKALKRQPSKVKAFLNTLYEKVKGLIPSPSPVPEPAHFQDYFGIEKYALAKLIS